MAGFAGSASSTADWEHFDLSIDDGVATISLNRPDKLNALTFGAYADLRDLLHQLAHRGGARVILLRGEGAAFCSGGDVREIIGELLAMSPDERLAFTRMTGEVVRAMREAPLPIVAAVRGIAAGAGSVLALASDLRVLGRSARFAFLFTKVGLAGADMGAAYLLPRLIGAAKATELLLARRYHQCRDSREVWPGNHSRGRRQRGSDRPGVGGATGVRPRPLPTRRPRCSSPGNWT